MKELSSLTYKEKILLHLKRYKSQKERVEKVESVTQKGISQNLGISRTHVSRVLGTLEKKNFIEEEVASVKGHERKLKTYFLTSEGKKKLEEIISELSNVTFKLIANDEEESVPLTDVEEKTDGKLDILETISILESSEDNTIDLEGHGFFEPVKMIEEAPQTEKFYGREEELKSMEDWIEGKKPFLSVIGQKGLGASTLTSEFVKNLTENHILWITLEEKDKSLIKEKISDFLKKVVNPTNDLIEDLLDQEVVLIFDNYYEVEEYVVSFLTRLLEKIDKEDPLRVIVTGREGTPVFERFYRPEHIDSGLVEELKLSTLGEKEAQQILERDIQEDALERIMMFTKGSPLLLELLREGKEEKLTEITPWEKEQISLLMYLKTETEEN